MSSSGDRWLGRIVHLAQFRPSEKVTPFGNRLTAPQTPNGIAPWPMMHN